MARGDNIRISSHDNPRHANNYHSIYEKPFFQHILILVIISTLIISIFSLVNTYQLKKNLIPKVVNTNDFLKKLTSHNEMKNYASITPLNIIQVNNNNLANLQAQMDGLDVSYIGNFIVRYQDKIVVYDYDNDKIRGNVNLQQQAKLPADFFTKLNKHPELQGLESQQPIGGQIDADSLKTLQQQFPNIYTNAKVGDFILRYQTKLIIYDYVQDKIVNTANLS